MSIKFLGSYGDQESIYIRLTFVSTRIGIWHFGLIRSIGINQYRNCKNLGRYKGDDGEA